jgi:gamma-glutamyltranspeptidase/glutathione hydrolase
MGASTINTQGETALRISRDLAIGVRDMVAAKHPLAVRAAVDVLERGGNAIDAAVTAAFSVGVLEPWMSGIGGGGFMTIQMASGERAVIDYFARAPQAARPDLYELTPEFGASRVGFSGVVGDANAFGPLSVGTPGMVRGMAVALERFGTRPLAEVLEPAIGFAENGFPVEWYQGMLIASQQATLKRDAETSSIFLASGLPPAPLFGDASPKMTQPDLARTLRLIAQRGPDGFYRGEVAERIVSHLQANGGILTLEDFAAYQAVIVDPLVIRYRDVELVLLPYQAGGTHVGEAFSILNGFDLAATGHNTAASLHLVAEASRRATADRAAYVGDPDFVDIDWARLTSAQYAAERRADIDMQHASRPSAGEGIARGAALAGAGGRGGGNADEGCTTHLSVVDRHGNMVSVTQTLTLIFGSVVTVPGTGVLLNDSMNLFDPRPGGPNAVGPRKRPASNMAHVIAVRDGTPVLAVGAPGGRRILDTCLQMTLNVVDYGLDIQAACAAPLIDCSASELLADDRLSAAALRGLSERGHEVNAVPVSFSPRQFASPTGVTVDPKSGLRSGGADPFGIGIAAGH